MSQNTLLISLPLAIPWISGVALALMDGRRKRTGWIAVTVLMATFASVAVLGINVHHDAQIMIVAGNWENGIGIPIRADMLGVTFALLSLGVIISALIFEVCGGVRSQAFPAVVVFLAAGLNGLFLTGDAFNFYVFFEISMISGYILAGYGEQARQLRSAMIFAVVNLLGSGFFLIGIASLYHITGRLDMAGISVRVLVFESQAVILSSVLIFTAFGIKLGIFPFHFWLPAVYTGTRPAVAAILSGAVANIGTYGLLRFGGEVLPEELTLGAPVLIALGVASIIYGSMQALSRRSIPEVLAYSSIGQVGYILVALAIGGEAGFAAAVLFAIVNALNKTLLFLSEDLAGWLVGFAFAVGAFSVAGVPPAGGFLGKAGLFYAATADDRWAIIALIILGSVLSIIYMFQAYQRRFWVPPEEGSVPRIASLPSTRAVVVVLALLTIAIGVWPEPVLWISEQAARAVPPGAP